MNPHSYPWFSRESAAVICLGDHFYHQYKRDCNADNLVKFKAERNHCKETLHQAKVAMFRNYEIPLTTKSSVQTSGGFTIVMKKGKSSTPALRIDNNRMGTSSADEPELLCKEVALFWSLRKTPH